MMNPSCPAPITFIIAYLPVEENKKSSGAEMCRCTEKFSIRAREANIYESHQISWDLSTDTLFHPSNEKFRALLFPFRGVVAVQI